MTNPRVMHVIISPLLVLALAVPLCAGDKRQKNARTLQDYLASLPQDSAKPQERTAGSLWLDGAALTDLAADYKAHRLHDIITVHIVEQTLAEASASVTSQRGFEANSGVTALAGKVNTSSLESLFSPHSQSKLQGEGKTASNSRLRTSLAGQVVSVLPNGSLVVQAERQVAMNNERQTVIVRGVVRAGDISANNAIVSTAMSNLEIELKGKGVITESTRPPNWIVRILLRVLGF
ncbi:MAG TPA: flagellar basal body L-ring protein FlgH [Clostridia bacterium]|nr:flagellar basal body L-ring protein FlgH [Clostridia bacterium]